MVARVCNFESDVMCKLVLHREVPGVDHGIAIVLVKLAERDRSRQRKDVRRESVRKAVEVRIRIEIAGTATLQVDCFVKWRGFPAIRIPALIFLSSIEDSIAQTGDRLLIDLVSNADTRTEVEH